MLEPIKSGILKGLKHLGKNHAGLPHLYCLNKCISSREVWTFHVAMRSVSTAQGRLLSVTISSAAASQPHEVWDGSKISLCVNFLLWLASLLPSLWPFSKRHVRQSPICQPVSTKGCFLVLLFLSVLYFITFDHVCLKRNICFDRSNSQNTCIKKKTLFMEEQYRGVCDLGWNYSTAIISIFVKHVGYYWLILHNYTIPVLSLYLSAVPLIQIAMCKRKKQKHVSKFRLILCTSKS